VKIDPQRLIRWLTIGGMVLAPGICLSFNPPLFLIFLSILFGAIVAECIRLGSKKAQSSVRTRERYRPRDTDAGRWLEAPVAELDKSTIGKLLASRASRDPSLHVVVRNTPPPTCTDALYDPEIDG
jgi:hypothetical protein